MDIKHVKETLKRSNKIIDIEVSKVGESIDEISNENLIEYIKSEGFNIFKGSILEEHIAFNDQVNKNIIINTDYTASQILDENKVSLEYVLLHEIHHILNDKHAPLSSQILEKIDAKETLMKLEPADYFAYKFLSKNDREDLIPKSVKVVLDFLTKEKNG